MIGNALGKVGPPIFGVLLLAIQGYIDDRHYVSLEADYEEGALDSALRGGRNPGVLRVFRDDAPVHDSEVSVVFPEQKLGGA